MNRTVLIAEDEPNIRSAMAEYLRAARWTVIEVSNGREARDVLRATPVDVVVSDIRMPEMGGHQLLAWIREEGPGAPVLLVTAHGEVAEAVEALRNGAADYMLKPFELSELLARVERCLRHAVAERRERIDPPAPDGAAERWFLPATGPFAAALDLVRKVAPTDATVLISGESGTGKEVIARLVHSLSARSAGPFVAVNVAAIPESLLESELFGHEKGAFTGADARRIGYIEAAQHGTLFLDEIGELPVQAQVKLLRVIQERSLQRVGSTTPIPVDARLVVATNRNLDHMVEEGAFRRDLYYRVKVIEIHLSALRDRPDDILGLADHLLPRIAQRIGRYAEPVPLLSARARSALREYSFPGNVRELENMLERALILNEPNQPIEPQTLGLQGVTNLVENARHLQGVTNLVEDARHLLATPAAGDFNLSEIERRTIERALAYCSGNRTRAAELLGIGRRTLQEKLKALDKPR